MVCRGRQCWQSFNLLISPYDYSGFYLIVICLLFSNDLTLQQATVNGLDVFFPFWIVLGKLLNQNLFMAVLSRTLLKIVKNNPVIRQALLPFVIEVNNGLPALLFHLQLSSSRNKRGMVPNYPIPHSYFHTQLSIGCITLVPFCKQFIPAVRI